MEQILCTLWLLQSKTQLKKLRSEWSDEIERNAFSSLNQASLQTIKGGIKANQVRIMLSLMEKLFSWCEHQNMCEISALNVSSRLLSKMQHHISEQDSHILSLLKYSVLIEKRSAQEVQTPLTFLHSRLRLQLTQIFSLSSHIRHIDKLFEHTNSGLLDQDKQTNIFDQQGEEDNHSITNLNQDSYKDFNSHFQDHIIEDDDKQMKLKEYLQKLNKMIVLELQPISKKFESFEKTISLLESIKSKFPTDSYYYTIANIEWARAKRLIVLHCIFYKFQEWDEGISLKFIQNVPLFYKNLFILKKLTE